MKYHDILNHAFEACYKSALPKNCLPSYIPQTPPKGKTYVIGAGKAAAEMAAIFESHYKYPFEGMVVTRYGHAVETKTIKVMEASHPVPDKAGEDAAKAMLAYVEQAREDDHVICLISGGGSALLTCPVDGVPFDDIQDLNKQLLGCGASITEINTVRKHLNQAFGGKLLKAASPAKVITLSISDVSGDDTSTIASGPTVGDPTTLSECLEIIQKYNLNTSDASLTYLADKVHETPKPNDAMFENSEYHLIATPQKSLEAAAAYIKEQGFTPMILSSMLEGDTDQVADMHVALVKQVMQYEQPLKRPCAIISGGETTVTLRGTGRGGPNTQFMLKAAIELKGQDNVYGIACDTDGIDGAQDNAGAIIDPETLKRAHQKNIDAKACLANNDSELFFQTIGNLVTPGPTYTNVNDFRMILITE